MFCKNCGAEIANNAVVCPKCGVPVAGENVQSQAAGVLEKAPNSISGFVCSLIGFCVPFVGVVFSTIALVLCVKGQKAVRMKPNAYSGTGFLTAGLILGIIGLVWSIGLIVYMIMAKSILEEAAEPFFMGLE